MVSKMESTESKCNKIDQQYRSLPPSAISQRSIDLQMLPTSDNHFHQQTTSIMDELSTKTLKLSLTKRADKNSSVDSDKYIENNLKSPKSPKSPNSPKSPSISSNRPCVAIRTIPHQPSSITSQIDVVEDRKALRDALYQGIFHRHRRTIFAVGSFLRMFRTRNAQYNTIRSTSEGDEDTR